MSEFSIEAQYLPQQEAAAFETESLVRVNFVPHNIMSQAGRDVGSESGENCDNFALFAPRGRASNNCWWKYGEGAAFFSPKLYLALETNLTLNML